MPRSYCLCWPALRFRRNRCGDITVVDGFESCTASQASLFIYVFFCGMVTALRERKNTGQCSVAPSCAFWSCSNTCLRLLVAIYAKRPQSQMILWSNTSSFIPQISQLPLPPHCHSQSVKTPPVRCDMTISIFARSHQPNKHTQWLEQTVVWKDVHVRNVGMT